MSTLRELVREIHRRSLWQVLGIYLVGGWVVLQVVDVVAENFGLPAWTFPFAVVLLLIGLPVVLATAFVQDGFRPSGRPARAAASATRRAGREPRHVARGDDLRNIPARHLLTWRNAMMGGLSAFALWGLVAAVYVGVARVPRQPSGADATLAVLPFDNVGDPADAYFADGMADDIRGRLAALPGLRVIAPGSVERYRNAQESPDAIARELGATHLLIARVRWDRSVSGQSRVRVTPELIAIERDGRATVQWQTSIDAVIQDVFAVQSEIAAAVSRGLDVVFGERERERLTARPTADLAAYDAYLRGTEVVRNSTTGDNAAQRRAIAYFEQAVALDSTFADAWAALARSLTTLWSNSTQAPDIAARALESARHALELAPELASAHAAMAGFYNSIEGDARRAAAAADLGLSHAPRDPGLLMTAASIALALGRADQAIERLDLARELDPLNARVADRRQLALIALRRYDEAIDDAARVLATDRGNLDATQNTVMAYIGRGDIASARAFLREAANYIEPDALVAYFGLYWDMFWILDDDQQQLLLTLPPASFDDNRASWALVRAQLYAHRGDSAAARAWGDTAVAAFDAQLRDDPGNRVLPVYRGLALALAGRHAAAAASAELGASRNKIGENTNGAYFHHQLARVYILSGRYDQAVDVLESVLRTAYYLSPGWLRVDPNFDPLRSHPRFLRLAEAA